MIQAQDLTKRYGRFVAVQGVTFEVPKGQIVGFLGPNGAGKTTTMRTLTCFMPPTSGTATVAGFDVVRQPMEVKKRIGYLPETPPLYPDMEVCEYLAFVAKLKGVPSNRVAAQVDDVAGRCNIGDVQKKLIARLSKGYRQRVGLAQTLLNDPEVLILDEPTAGLDPLQIHETRELIRGLGGDRTIILSTHILSEVEQVCDQVIIIKQGRIVAEDSVDNLTHRLRGQEAVAVEVAARDGQLDLAEVRRQLERVPGVSRVLDRDSRRDTFCFEVESLAGSHIRPELARAVVEAGWNLIELRATSVSLEEIFLELTSGEQSSETGEAA